MNGIVRLEKRNLGRSGRRDSGGESWLDLWEQVLHVRIFVFDAELL